MCSGERMSQFECNILWYPPQAATAAGTTVLLQELLRWRLGCSRAPALKFDRAASPPGLALPGSESQRPARHSVAEVVRRAGDGGAGGDDSGGGGEGGRDGGDGGGDEGAEAGVGDQATVPQRPAGVGIRPAGGGAGWGEALSLSSPSPLSLKPGFNSIRAQLSANVSPQV